MLDILKRYQKSGKALAAEQPILDRIIYAEEARTAARMAIETSHVFLRIERVIPEVPQELFGNPVPSKAHNRISIHTAPGEPPLISALISETGLAMMTMGMNRTSDPAELTLERINGKRVAPADMTDLSPLDRMLTQVSDEYVQNNVKTAQTVHDTLKTLRKPLGKADTSDLAKSVAHGFSFREGTFFAKIFRESEGQRAAFTRSEASNLVKCAHLLGSPDAPVFEPEFEPENLPEMSPLSRRNPAHNAIWARALAHEMMGFAAERGLENYDPRKDPKGATLAGAFPYGSEDAKRMKQIGEQLFMFLNVKDTDVDMRVRDPRHLIGEMNRISGNAPLHSDSGADMSGFVSLRLLSAEVSYDFGRRRAQTRTGVPFFEVNITPTDLMMALRGDPDGDVWTRCSLRTAYGQSLPMTPYVHPLDKKIDTVKVQDSPLNREQKQRGAALAAHIQSTSLKTVADRNLAEQMSQELLDNAQAANAEGLAQLRDACETVSEHVNSELSVGLEKMMRGRHATALMHRQDAPLLSGPDA